MSQETRKKDIYEVYEYSYNARYVDIHKAYNLALKHLRDAIEEHGEGVILRMLSSGEFEATEEDLM